MLTILIPVRDEIENLNNIVQKFNENLTSINYEVIFVNDFSSDSTLEEVKKICNINKKYKVFNNQKKGLGGALNLGIEKAEGKYICIMMSDLSDDINDLIKYYKIMNEKDIDAVFGSRFLGTSKTKDYPINKLILNRIFNIFVKLIYFRSYNDYTNAFKIYRSDVLKSFIPLFSESFNVFLEIPLKLINRKYKYEVIPINWSNRKKGKAKFNIKELRSKYLSTLIRCYFEKFLIKK